MKVRENHRVVNAVVLVATGVNNDGRREVLGVRVATAETGPAWNEFFADLVARGLAPEDRVGTSNIWCSSLRSSTDFTRLGNESKLSLLSAHSSVELTGLEPVTYSLRTNRATICAIAPGALRRRPG